jgi:hypothetical protein
MTLRLRSLAGLAALALPLAAMTTATLTATAQAATAQAATCSPNQATVTFANGNSVCQDVGPQEYLPSAGMPAAKQVCAGANVTAFLIPYALFVPPRSCADVPPLPLPLTVAVNPA